MIRISNDTHAKVRFQLTELLRNCLSKKRVDNTSLYITTNTIIQIVTSDIERHLQLSDQQKTTDWIKSQIKALHNNGKMMKS